MNKINKLIGIIISFSIVLFFIHFFLGPSALNGEHWYERYTDINKILLWFAFYIFLYIVGMALRLYEDGGKLNYQEIKEIKAWKASKSKNSKANINKITLADKLIFKHGHPFDVSVWTMDRGFINWLVLPVIMGVIIIIVSIFVVGLVIWVLSIPIEIFKNLF